MMASSLAKKKALMGKAIAALALASTYPSGSAAKFSSFLLSDFFTIILVDPARGNLTSSTTSDSTVAGTDEQIEDSTTTADRSEPFYIHRALLASLSPELFNHVYNDMSEGIEGSMKLREVDGPTMERFLEWAYSRAYSVAEKSASALLPHIKIYALAERFNITALKDLAYSHFTELLCKIDLDNDKDEMTHVLSAARYAFENIPVGSNLFSPPTPVNDTNNTTSSSSNANSTTTSSTDTTTDTTTTPKGKNLLKYFGQYVSWSLDAFRTHPDFLSLLEESPDFAKIIVCNSCPATNPPWPATSICASTPNSHVLKRSCANCGYTGMAVPLCAGCGRYDHDVGIEVQVGGGKKMVVGEERTSGTRDAPNYKCVWCNNQYTYGTSNGYNRRLYCRKCNNNNTTPAP